MEIVINHALKYFKTKNLLFKSIVLLQPTSPIRKIRDFKNVKKMFRKDILALALFATTLFTSNTANAKKAIYIF